MTTPATIRSSEVFELLRDDLAAIEREFGRDTVSRVGVITEIGEYLRAGGGKRIRPALLLLAAKLFNYQGTGAVKLASVVEIIHTATLVHDDVLDEASTRRHVRTVNAGPATTPGGKSGRICGSTKPNSSRCPMVAGSILR